MHFVRFASRLQYGVAAVGAKEKAPKEVHGYFLKQISDPKIAGIDISNSPEQAGAIGPGMVWIHKSGSCM